MSYSANGIAFSAMPTNYLNSDNNNEATKETSKIEDIQYSYKTSNTDGTIVEFRDPTNNKNVSVSLNENVLDKLKSHFSSQDFDKNENGSLSLSGETEKFVSGWFGDIAYKREFLSADKNQDGNLDNDEYLNTRNDFNIDGIFHNKTIIEENIHSKYIKINTKKYLNYSNNMSKNINEELNKTIGADKNFDSKMTLEEAYSTMGGSKTVILSHAKELGLLDKLEIKENMFSEILENKSKNKSLNKEEELKKLEALMKLLQANGDASKLTASEREILGSELQKYTKDITKELSDSLSTKLDKKIVIELDTKTQILEKEDKKLQTLQKLQQTNGDISQLSKDEKELITTEIEKSKKEDGNIDKDKLNKIIDYHKTSKVYNEIEASQMVGKYYEEKG